MGIPIKGKRISRTILASLAAAPPLIGIPLNGDNTALANGASSPFPIADQFMLVDTQLNLTQQYNLSPLNYEIESTGYGLGVYSSGEMKLLANRAGTYMVTISEYVSEEEGWRTVDEFMVTVGTERSLMDLDQDNIIDITEVVKYIGANSDLEPFEVESALREIDSTFKYPNRPPEPLNESETIRIEPSGNENIYHFYMSCIRIFKDLDTLSSPQFSYLLFKPSDMDNVNVKLKNDKLEIEALIRGTDTITLRAYDEVGAYGEQEIDIIVYDKMLYTGSSETWFFLDEELGEASWTYTLLSHDERINVVLDSDTFSGNTLLIVTVNEGQMPEYGEFYGIDLTLLATNGETSEERSIYLEISNYD